MRVEEVVPDRQEIMYDFMNHDPLEECMFKSLYKENLDGEKLNTSAELIRATVGVPESTKFVS